MHEFSDQDLIRYVLGESPPATAQAIATQASTDPELAATIELLGQCGAGPLVPATAVNGRRDSKTAWAKRIAFAVVACLAVSGLSWAGWVLFAEKPLLEDNFNSNWGDFGKWRTPRRGVFVENGHLRLFDRGCLMTAEEFPGPIDLTFRWRLTDLAGDFLYRDELTVALRTSGVPRDERAYELTDGILVKFNVTSGQILIKPADDLFQTLADTGDGSTPLPAEHWHKVRITDDGETVSVSITGLGSDAGNRRQLSAKIPRTFPHHRIAFYNRERLASTSFESWIDDVVLRRLAGAGRR